MEIADSLKTEIKSIESQLRKQSAEAERTARESEQAGNEAAGIYKTMNFRERYLRGWFGGDRKKVANYRKQLTLKEYFNTQTQGFRATAEGFNRKAARIVDEHLRRSDSVYQGLVKPYDAAAEVKKEINAFLGKIDNALSEIDDAQSMEAFDLVSNNKGIAVMSHIANGEAKDAIEGVKRAAPAFQKAVSGYNEFLKNYQAPQIEAEIGDTMDLIFDLAFDGFDFMSFFTLAKLNDAESNMKDARAKVEEVDGIVGKNLEKTREAVKTYAGQVRKACLN